MGGTIGVEKKHTLGGGDTAHTLLGWGHRTTLKEKLNWVVGSVLVRSVLVRSVLVRSVLAGNDTTSWLHLASSTLPDSQMRIQDGALMWQLLTQYNIHFLIGLFGYIHSNGRPTYIWTTS